MADTEFLRPRLCGARFESGVIPLDVLGDLTSLGAMLIEVAKWRFLQENPDRERSPRGFADGVELKLVRIERGSAVAVIGVEPISLQRSLDSPEVRFRFQQYFEAAREAIVSAIAAAEAGGPILEHLPLKCLSYFDRVGRSLRGEEAIEFTSPASSTVARLTRESRRELVRASARGELTEPVRLRGYVPEVDQEKRTFHLHLMSGSRIPGPMPEQHFESIMEAFIGYSEGTKILVDGIGRWSRQKRLVGIEDIQQIAVLDPLDVASSLAEFRQLANGWLDGEGLALDRPGLDWFEAEFETNYPDDLPLPHLCPTPDGGIHAEWSFPPHELGLEIDLVSRKADWYRVDMASDTDCTRELNLSEEQGWKWLIEQVRAASCPKP